MTGKEVKALRRQMRLTQRELAERKWYSVEGVDVNGTS